MAFLIKVDFIKADTRQGALAAEEGMTQDVMGGPLGVGNHAGSSALSCISSLFKLPGSLRQMQGEDSCDPSL